MTDSLFNDFVNTLDFSGLSGPTPVEEAHDALEQRDLAIRLNALFNAGVLRGLDGSTAAERSAWRHGADLALGALPRRCDPETSDGPEMVYELNRMHLYALLIKSICAAYRHVEVSIVHAAADAVLSLYTHEVDAEQAGAWQNNLRPTVLTQVTLVRLAMQAAYIYSDLHPAAVLH